MARIAFLDDTTPYTGESLRSGPLGGIQACTVELAEAFAARGHEVTVFNRAPVHAVYEGVSWHPLSDAGGTADLAIANNHARLLKPIDARVPVVWLHNPVKIGRLIKRGNFWPALQLHPHAVCLSQYHRALTKPWLPFRDRTVLEHGTAPRFHRDSPAQTPPPPRALFTSQPYRGLDWLVDVWRDYVHKAVPEAELHIFTPKSHQLPESLRGAQTAGIHVRDSIAQDALAEELKTARVLLYPGHYDETFCRAAAEARAAGLPIVTRGIGALSERVSHARSGFIAPQAEDFARYAAGLLTDDSLWCVQHRTALEDAAGDDWDTRAHQWEERFLGPL